MLDIGWMEMAVIAIIALLVVGPRELPRVIRSVTEFVNKARGMAREFKSGLDDIARETELASLKADMQSVADDANAEYQGLTDEAASTHDFSSDDDDHDDWWNTIGSSWRRVEPGEGARKNPKRNKKARAHRPRPRMGPTAGRRKVRS